ncbi:MAG: response regulator, partial [Planctomycetes bacterium]|nr:response regulator [Planctomycetota bacterium]
LSCGIDPDVPDAVRGDSGRLRQVLLNLVGNAVKFTDKGEVAVRITVDALREGRALVRFAVRDTGIGIPAGRRSEIFRPFTQADSSVTRRFGGTGLGLSIVLRLAEMMGGAVGVESEEGRGSLFWFTADLALGSRKKATRGYALASLEGRRVLVVDDNETNRRILVGRLASWRCLPEAVASGPEAVAALRRARAEGKPIGLLLTDQQMPGMDGITLGRILQADPQFRDLPRILLTSVDRPAPAQELREAGFSACLVKPIKHAALREALAAVAAAGTTSRADGEIITDQHLVLSPRRDARILLAEDNATNRKVALRMLEKMGYRAEVAENGLEALKALSRERFDLVLMDVEMPVMDGLQAARTVRDPASDALDHGIPIVAMTAHAMKGDRERFLEAGMDEYVSKPVQPLFLRKTVERLLARRDPPGEGPAPDSPGHAEAAGLDLAALLERLDGDRSFCRDLLSCFLEEASGRLEALEAALSGRDAETLRLQAHSIKGSAANVEARRASGLAASIEDAARRGAWEGVGRLAGELRAEIDGIRSRVGEIS